MSFWGHPRPDGTAAARNCVGVISTVACANDVAQWIAGQVPGRALLAHQQGCGQGKADMELARRALLPVWTGVSNSLSNFVIAWKTIAGRVRQLSCDR